ncbi:MAG: MFS transporter [Phenylobacterium sp.]|uniref:MFS transporter n=1 Tax=Phenylobacterium sp. TaxID=1871053 RepID=UPI0027334583|nr:MFS transporter [Phenylobacterium sp.]MDP3173553.1 MFS transporter [Phenylobacterium sp.]
MGSDDTRVPVRTKAVFAVGSAAENVALTAVGGFALFYYNQVLGMPATLAGLAMSVSLILDGLSDPIIGSISDRTRHKLGRRHPFMYVAPIPIALSLIAIFNPPAGLPHLWLFAWFTSFVVSLRVFMAIYHTPHLAMAAEMSDDFAERSRVLSWNALFSYLAAPVTSFVALSTFFKATEKYPRGVLNPDAYSPFAISAALVGLLFLFISAWGTRHLIPRMTAVPDHVAKFSASEFFKDVGAALANKSYLFMLIGFFFISLTNGLRSGLQLYIQTFFWELTSEQIRWFMVATMAGFFVSFFVTARVHMRFGKGFTMAFAIALFSVLYAIPVIARMAGLLPDASDPIVLPILMLTTFVTSIFAAMMSISTMSALADIADENELRFGRRQEGVLYATRTMFSKIDIAIGQFLAGLALDLVAFPTGAKPGQVDHETLMHLAWIDGPIAIVPGLLSAYFYARFRITRAVFEENKRLLAERRAQPS